jgi:hypothetical protein
VTNSGLIVGGGRTRFTGTYAGDGAYTSSDGESRFEHATVAPGGYWTGRPGANFLIDSDLDVRSRRPADWDTSGARLGFTGSGVAGAVLLGVAGADLGPHYAGYQDDFAWGALELPSGLSLNLRDGNDEPGGALYVGGLVLGGGTSQIASITGNGLSIYYDPAAPANAYLAGRTYSLSSGGSIMPVPEPTDAVLIAAFCLPPLLRRHRGRGARPE